VSLSIQPAATDLLLPRAEPGQALHPYTVHTHYFGFTVPEAGIGAFLYARYMPAFGLAQGGPVIFRGMDNVSPLDVEYHDYRATMPWPEVEGNTIRLDCGYEIDIVKPGELIHLRYESPDGEVGFELDQRAVTPLIARGHVVPGEEAHHASSGLEHGGSEQFMHCTGELRLRGETYPVDCHAVRDRSWNQVRTEEPGGAPPGNPVGWSPAWFGDDLAFNVTSAVSPEGETSAYYKWLVRDGELVELTGVRRSVLEYHPVLHSAVRQELELVDGEGRRQRFEGRAIAVAPVYAWPNVAFRDSVFRWEDEQGRVTHCTYQEIFWDRFQHKMSRG
jgi:hypothetical protein